jgi:hypothetical protein
MATAKKTATAKKIATTKKRTVRRPARPLVTPRRDSVLDTVKRLGLLEGPRNRIAGRIRGQLIKAAKARSGIRSDTQLLEYALAQVALEDDFWRKLWARRGTIPPDIDLEF